ncbi:MAG: hypothetical protein FD169_2501 [Bacillota bacterium]|nr:MAG: hypothetical protein FD169_2501 [Bacillota bacterium]
MKSDISDVGDISDIYSIGNINKGGLPCLHHFRQEKHY